MHEDGTDVRDALAAVLRTQGLVAPEPERAQDMTPERARETVWGSYGMTPPPVEEY